MPEFGERGWAELQLANEDLVCKPDNLGVKPVVATSHTATWARLRTYEIAKEWGLVLGYKTDLASRNPREGANSAKDVPNEGSGGL